MKTPSSFVVIVGAIAALSLLGASTWLSPNPALADENLQVLADTPTSTATVSPSATVQPSANPSVSPTRPAGPKPDDADKPGKKPGKDDKSDKEKRRTFTGEVTALGANQFTLKDRNGRVVTVLVDASTKYHQPGNKNAGFADLKVKQRVSAFGVQQRTAGGSDATPTLKAQQVKLPKVKDRFEHVIGEITALSDTSITVKDREGKSTTGVLNSDTKKQPTGATFAVGDRVLVQARFDESQGSEGAWVVSHLVKLGTKPAPKPSGTPPSSSPSTSTATATATSTATSTSTATVSATATP